jgi:hypothetical protein
LQVDFTGAGAAGGAAAGAEAGACAVWAQAVTVADIEIAKAIAKALRIKLSIRGENPYSGKSIAALTYGVNAAADGRIIGVFPGGRIVNRGKRPPSRIALGARRAYVKELELEAGMSAIVSNAPLSRPLLLVAVVGGALVAAALGLWAYYGTAVFFEMVRAGWLACF